MSQPRKQSMLEVSCNTASGFVLALLVNWLLHIWFGKPLSGGENLAIALAFTAISLVRSYFWRRVFNWWQHG